MTCNEIIRSLEELKQKEDSAILDAVFVHIFGQECEACKALVLGLRQEHPTLFKKFQEKEMEEDFYYEPALSSEEKEDLANTRESFLSGLHRKEAGASLLEKNLHEKKPFSLGDYSHSGFQKKARRILSLAGAFGQEGSSLHGVVDLPEKAGRIERRDNHITVTFFLPGGIPLQIKKKNDTWENLGWDEKTRSYQKTFLLSDLPLKQGFPDVQLRIQENE